MSNLLTPDIVDSLKSQAAGTFIDDKFQSITLQQLQHARDNGYFEFSFPHFYEQHSSPLDINLKIDLDETTFVFNTNLLSNDGLMDCCMEDCTFGKGEKTRQVVEALKELTSKLEVLLNNVTIE